MKVIGEIVIPENGADRTAVSRRLKAGGLVKLVPGIYTSTVDQGIETVSRRNWMTIVGHVFPNHVVTYRSALYGPLASGGKTLFLSGPSPSVRTFPGFDVQVSKGPGPLEGDTPFGPSLFLAGRSRAILDSLKPSSTGRVGERKGITREEAAEALSRIYQSAGIEEVNLVRDRAREISQGMNSAREFAVLDDLCGELLGTRALENPTRTGARSRFQGAAIDIRRMDLFEKLVFHLKADPVRGLTGRPTDRGDRSFGFELRVLPFIDAYFSNYIEGTRFELQEAISVVGGTAPLHRPADSKDIIGSYILMSNRTALAEIEKISDPQAFIDLLRKWHRGLMSGRPEKSPGELKTIPNMAGTYRFVDPDKVHGTLSMGFDLSKSLDDPMERGMFLKFLVSEVHPFLDGNGRLSRSVLNAVLISNGLERVVIPSVFRVDYLTAMSALSNSGNAIPFVKAIQKAQRWVHHAPDSSHENLVSYMKKTHAQEDPYKSSLVVPDKGQMRVNPDGDPNYGEGETERPGV